MVKQFIQLKLSIHDSNKGFTLLELLIALVIASILVSLSLKLIVDQRELFVKDQNRTQINQNLRAAIDLVGTDIKQTGERLVGNTRFPVVRVIDGVGLGTPLSDELVIQRKIIAQELPVCANVTGAQSTIIVSTNPGNTSCPFSNANTDPLPDNLEQWRDARCDKDSNNACDRTANVAVANDGCIEQGGTDRECFWAYIYSPTNNSGEFFLYDSETSDSIRTPSAQTRYHIRRAQSTIAAKNNWQNTYTYTAPTTANPNPTNPVLYILEERHYRLANHPNSSITNDKVLELILNRQCDDVPVVPVVPVEGSNRECDKAIRLVNQLSNFQVKPLMLPTASALSGDNFNATFNVTSPFFNNNWQQLRALNVTLTARSPSEIYTPRSADYLSVSAQFFPRNAASKQ